MANFQITPCLAPADWNELAFQGLYMYHTPLGPNPNQATLIENKGPIGETIGNNWEVYDGPGSDANVVARAQGLHIQAGNWVNSFTLVFENEGFSGSTLQVMGITVESGEWAIVGGTGEFTMATGAISKKLHEQRSDGNVIELTIRALCPRHKGARYPVTKIGPWGGNGGSPQDITDSSTIKRLEEIIVHSGQVVDSIQFAYVDSAGQTCTAGPWGGSGGELHRIQLAESEFLTQVSGTTGSFSGLDVVTSIKFVTNLDNTYGPWGEEMGTPFTVPVQPGGAVVGFFAQGGIFLDAIGVYVRPL